MIPTLVSAFVAAACALASARRLAFAVLPMWFDAQLLARVLAEDGSEGVATLRQMAAAAERATWERELLAAASSTNPMQRPALVNEQLREFDWRVRRWARVPRVCASIATSAGFLCGCVAIIQGLASDTSDLASVLMSAVIALTVGVAGTAFCVAVHIRASRAARRRLEETDRFVERLEGLLI